MNWEKFGPTIYFFCDFNDDIDEKLVKKMSNISYVEFVDYKNLYDTTAMYEGYTYYSFGNHHNIFNKSVDLFPLHIKSIIFKDSFNQPVPNLPLKLKELVFGKRFNQSVSNLPPKLVKLIFGDRFNQLVDNLPPIKILALGTGFDNSLDYLPSSITHLEIYPKLLVLSANLPSSIKYLVLDLPPSMKYLVLEEDKYRLSNEAKFNIPPSTKIIYNKKYHKKKYLSSHKIKL